MAGYDVYLDKMLLPITPSSIETTINSQNETITLINEGEVNILKAAGLTDIEFECLIPSVEYPFAKYIDGKFVKPKEYLDKLEELKKNKEPFQFIVTRAFPDGKALFHTNTKVTIEDYSISESSEHGFDSLITVSLKQWRPYGTKKISLTEPKKKEKAKAKVKKARDKTNSPKPKKKPETYEVKSGDCLWIIAKKYYGDGSLYTKIFEANKDKISNPNLIYPGQKFIIPV